MDATVLNPLNAPVFEIPDPTEDFGQDGGKFYRCYDALADEIDEDLVTGLKEQLDGMLIFAGLFAGVNTAFLAFTLPLLSADPADDTNTLLAQNNAILIQLVTGRNDSIPANSALPSAGFSPAGNIFAINALFSLSLAFAIISSFLAVLGRQWLVYYRKRSGGGPDRQRWEQLKRYLGAERWRLKPILDDVLPSLLQIGLIIFCASLLLYLHHLSPAIAVIVGIPLYIGLAFFVGSALCTVWDKFCPFYSPLSHMLFWSARKIPSALDKVKGLTWDNINSFSLTPLLYVLVHGRTEESPESLQVIALQRAICTSDDPATLLSATANIFGITNVTQMKRLWGHDAFRERFAIQLGNSYFRTLQLRGHDQVKFAEGVQRLYCAAAAHIVLFLDIQFSEFPFPFLWAMRYLREASVVIPGPRIPESPNSLIRSTLAFAILQLYSYSAPLEIPLSSFQDHIVTCYNGQKRPDWRLLCVLSFIVSNLPRLGEIKFSSLDPLRKAYRGDTEHATVILTKAFDVLVGANSSDDPDLGEILVDMLRSVQQVITDDSAPWEHRFVALGSCERALRGPRLPEASKQKIRKLRLDFSQSWERECEAGAANWDIPTSLFDELYHYLQNVRTISQGDITCDESIIVLHAFGLPTIKLFAHDIMAWKQPREINKKRGDLRKVFDEFVSEVDGISRRIQANARHIRDPDGRWCHWQEELVSIKALYSLPSVLSEVPTIPAGHNGIVNDDPSLSLDTTNAVFNYMFNVASSRS